MVLVKRGLENIYLGGVSMPDEQTTRLKLVKPAVGKLNWADDWHGNVEKIDNNPGIRPCTSVTRPSAPWDGQVVYETDTDKLKVYNGTEWVDVGGGVLSKLVLDCVLGIGQVGDSYGYGLTPALPTYELTSEVTS
jgi:hypothetical protein